MKLPAKPVPSLDRRLCHKQDLSKATHTLTVWRIVLAAEPHVLSALKYAAFEVAAVRSSSQRRLFLINLHFEMSPSQSPYRYVISCFR